MRGDLFDRLGGAARQQASGRAPAYPDDLRLARACTAGDPQAVRAFEEEVLPVALRGTSRILPGAEVQDELKQVLRERLFLAEPQRPARLGDYNGSVPLVAWVRVIARRCALNLRETRARRPDSLDDHPEPISSGTPEQALGRERFQSKFRAAFEQAMKTLSSRDRAVLRLHLAEGVTLEGVASAYGVHRATVVRWLATSRAVLMERTREALSRGLGASDVEVDSLLRAARSNLDVSIGSIFRSGEQGA